MVAIAEPRGGSKFVAEVLIIVLGYQKEKPRNAKPRNDGLLMVHV